jgi:hypothetical protein
MGEGRPWLKFSPLPLLIGHHLPAPSPHSHPRAAGDGAQPVEGRERAGGGLAGAAGAGGWFQLSPPPLPAAMATGGGDQEGPESLLREWGERGSWKV